MKEYRRSTGTMTALLSGRSTDVRKAEVNRDELGPGQSANLLRRREVRVPINQKIFHRKVK
jgi:hypothetical protein